MKLKTRFWGLLPIFTTLAVLAAPAVSFAEDASSAKATAPKPMEDTPPLATGLRTANTACSKVVIDGKTAWQRGYDQAMSGTHWAVGINFKTGTLKPSLKACHEYTKYNYGPKELECCRAGLADGYQDIQKLIADNINDPSKAEKSAEAKLCYKSFGAGRLAANKVCSTISKMLCGDAPQNDEDIERVGCASLGYVTALSQCRKIKESQKTVISWLKGGALADSGMLKRIAESACVEPANFESSSSAITPAAEAPPAGN